MYKLYIRIDDIDLSMKCLILQKRHVHEKDKIHISKNFHGSFQSLLRAKKHKHFATFHRCNYSFFKNIAIMVNQAFLSKLDVRQHENNGLVHFINMLFAKLDILSTSHLQNQTLHRHSIDIKNGNFDRPHVYALNATLHHLSRTV